jgi:quercetin dioxygenase-like cupin family protein
MGATPASRAKVTRNALETGRGPSDWFTGAVYVDTVATPSEGSRLSASSVHFTPGGEEHWHGATPNRFMTHLAMFEVDDDGNPAIWGDHVTDEEYEAAPAIDD